MSRERLRQVSNSLPIDSLQRKALEEGIANISEETAKSIAEDMEDALSRLPDILFALEFAIKKLEEER